MRMLIVGGTSFVGRHLTQAALAGGHTVTLANRGRSDPDLFPEAQRVRIDRSPGQPDLSGLRGREFDATIDVCAYWPGRVHALAAALEHRGGRQLHVSSVPAYADPVPHGADESAPLAQLPGAVDRIRMRSR